jgi:hypothetical protein
MTNLLSYVGAAYKAVALSLMLDEAGHFSKILNLPIPQPLRVEDLSASRVSPPRFGFSGMISTTNYSFGFADNKLRFVHRRGHLPEDESELRAAQIALSKQKSFIDTNGAYQLATQWLGAVAADLASLSRLHAQTEQEFIFAEPVALKEVETTKVKKIYLPVYNVTWEQTVSVRILGTTRELWHLRFDDGSFSLRPIIVITNAAELNTRPEPARRRIQPP